MQGQLCHFAHAGSLIQRHSCKVNHVVSLMQGNSCALMVSSKAAAGVEPPELQINELVESPADTAAKHAARYCDNVPPVRHMLVTVTVCRPQTRVSVPTSLDQNPNDCCLVPVLAGWLAGHPKLGHCH